jgi:four helix bundle protein
MPQKPPYKKPDRKKPNKRREAGWVKKDRTWRSDKAQRTARGDSGPAKKKPGGYKTYSEIPAHKLGRELRKLLYEVANKLPDDEKDNLKSRIKYAATTITSALAQGHGEGAYRAGIGRTMESRGALVVIQDHLDQLIDLGMIAKDEGAALKQEVDKVIQAVNDYLGRLTKDKNRT